MKKNVFLIVLCIFCFSSCTNLYSKINNLEYIKSKTSMKPFTHLNEPIVPLFGVSDQYSLFGNANLSSYYKACGEIFVVYDWENEEVYDWAYCDGLSGVWKTKATEIGENYYVAGFGSSIIGELSSESGKVTQIHTGIKGQFMNINSNIKPRSKYGIIDGPGLLNGGQGSFGFYIFDSEKKNVNSNGILRATDHPGYLFFPFADETGNYWFGYTENSKNWLINIDCEKNEVSKQIFMSNVNENREFEVLDVVFASNEYVFVSGGIRLKYDCYLYLYNKNDDSIKKILIPRDSANESLCLYMAFEIDGKKYAIAYGEDGNLILEIDIENLKFKEVTRFNRHFSDTVYVRGSRLYLLTTPGNSFSIYYYDFEKGYLSDTKTFTFDDVVK